MVRFTLQRSRGITSGTSSTCRRQVFNELTWKLGDTLYNVPVIPAKYEVCRSPFCKYGQVFNELILEARSSVGFTTGSLKALVGLQYYAAGHLRCTKLFLRSSNGGLLFPPVRFVTAPSRHVMFNTQACYG